MKVHRFADGMKAFLPDMHSGQVFECDEQMYRYFLEVLPPVWMAKTIRLNGQRVFTNFGFAEGAELVTAFWKSKNGKTLRYFGCRTDIMNTL